LTVQQSAFASANTTAAFAESQYEPLAQVTALVPPHLVLSSQQHVVESQVPLVVEPQYMDAGLVFNLKPALQLENPLQVDCAVQQSMDAVEKTVLAFDESQ
jgi:hypothetical protein